MDAAAAVATALRVQDAVALSPDAGQQLASSPAAGDQFRATARPRMAVSDIPEGYISFGLKFTQFSFFGDRFLVSLTRTSLVSR